MFHGSIVAIVTPMQPDGQIDSKALARLIDWHIVHKTDGIVVLGSTGEGATIEPKERREIIKTAVKQARSRCPIIAGTGTNSTQNTIMLTKEAMTLGVDACLLVTPYYNKPTQEGLYQHFTTVAQAVPIPQILYNVPSRTACDMLPETVIRLARYPNIIGIKEATGDISRVDQILGQVSGEFDLYSGDDGSSMEVMLAGGKGVISVTTNIAPTEMRQMADHAVAGRGEQATEIHQKLTELFKLMSIETNPIPVKWALYEMGLIAKGIRMPLTWLSEQYHETLRQALQRTGIVAKKR